MTENEDEEVIGEILQIRNDNKVLFIEFRLNEKGEELFRKKKVDKGYYQGLINALRRLREN